MTGLPDRITTPAKSRLWPRRVFFAVWPVSAILVLANFIVLTLRHEGEMATIHRLGGVVWQYQGDADSEWYAVRHPDGFFGLITINATSFNHFLLSFGIVGLLLSALIYWRQPLAFVAPVLLTCFMAPQLIILAGSLAPGMDFPGGVFEMKLDPASRTATGWNGTIPLCRITSGDAVPDGRWVDVDLGVNGTTNTLVSFHESSAAYGLLDQVSASVRMGCPNSVINPH
jgi:hypothetical protein